MLAISAVRDAEDLPCNYVGVMTDISQLKDSQARLEYLAHYDPLTSLPNRLLLHSRLTHALESADRHKRRVGVLYIDLDQFKNVNDSLGHPVGDELLEAFAQRLLERVRDEDTLGRLGGDEFLLILEDLGAAMMPPTFRASSSRCSSDPSSCPAGTRSIWVRVSASRSIPTTAAAAPN